MFRTALTATALMALTASAAVAEAHAMDPLATASIAGVDGTDHGSVTLTPTASGTMIVRLELTGVPAGVHGVHIHETGDCSAADFTSAGGHLAGDRAHGPMDAGGPHPGDLPNITVGEDGTWTGEVFNDHLTEALLADADGAAFIIHAGADDYTSQPAGDAGDRIACGVFEMAM